MPRSLWTLGGVLFSLAALAQAAEPPTKPLVKAQLLSDSSGVRAGSQFHLGVLFDIEPGWHIYWKDPGDAGLATAIQFETPADYQVGELRWPVHQTWVLPGDIKSNGYEKTVLLSAPVSAPASLEAGQTASVTAKVRWLACKEICIPGKTELKLDLPAIAEPQPANQELFTAWEAKLPPSSP